jgi:hypothetical protein
MGWLSEHLGLDKPARSSQFGDVDPGGQMGSMVGAAGGSATMGDAGYGQMTGQLQGDRRYLQDLRSGKNSLAAEQLRQGLAQQQGQMIGTVASARPGQAPMAARTATLAAGRAGSAMAGNAAMAGIAERNAAAQSLANMNLQQRGQDIQYSTGQRGLAVQGLSALEQARAQRYAADMQTPSNKEVLIGGLSGLARAFGGGG